MVGKEYICVAKANVKTTPRDWRLSASWDPIKGLPETPVHHKALLYWGV